MNFDIFVEYIVYISDFCIQLQQILVPHFLKIQSEFHLMWEV
jgi:hypothetical protein